MYPYLVKEDNILFDQVWVRVYPLGMVQIVISSEMPKLFLSMNHQRTYQAHCRKFLPPVYGWEFTMMIKNFFQMIVHHQWLDRTLWWLMKTSCLQVFPSQNLWFQQWTLMVHKRRQMDNCMDTMYSLFWKLGFLFYVRRITQLWFYNISEKEIFLLVFIFLQYPYIYW